MANINNEFLLINCRKIGYQLYYSCVLIPPANPEEIARCETLLQLYNSCSTQLNMPEAMIPSKDSTIYSISAFDPCKFEVQHLILHEICNNNPIDYKGKFK